MATKTLPDVGLLRQLLDYDPETGVLTWRKRTPDMFKAGARQNNAAAIWNAKYAGQHAGALSGRDGYLRVSINDALYLAHRVAWAIFYGQHPSDCMDHINGNRTDNRISNLRLASISENNRNLARRLGTASGVLGVARSGRKWRSYIEGNHIGTFDTKEDAALARKIAEEKLGYHRNHGMRLSRRSP